MLPYDGTDFHFAFTCDFEITEGVGLFLQMLLRISVPVMMMGSKTIMVHLALESLMFSKIYINFFENITKNTLNFVKITKKCS